MSSPPLVDSPGRSPPSTSMIDEDSTGLPTSCQLPAPCPTEMFKLPALPSKGETTVGEKRTYVPYLVTESSQPR